MKPAGSNGYELGPIGGPLPKIPDNAQAGAGTSAPVRLVDPPAAPSNRSVSRPMSMMSGKSSRRSKWGDNDAEPLGDVHKRQWIEVDFPACKENEVANNGLVSK